MTPTSYSDEDATVEAHLGGCLEEAMGSYAYSIDTSPQSLENTQIH